MEQTQALDFINTLLPLVSTIFIIAVGVVMLNQHFRKNLYRQKLAQEELKNIHQQELLRSSIQVLETERKRIAQDIHDELGAVLSISRMHVVQLEQLHKEDIALLPALQNVRNLTETAIAAMRRISHELMPLQLETFGLIKTLEAMATQANKTGEINIEIIAAPDLQTLVWPIKIGLYRINMELINNTLKHAHAKTIQIEFSSSNNIITCQYSDDGIGIVDNGVTDGLGHKSMEGRVNSLGGNFTMGNKETGGFYARIEIPITG
ncbi:MAG: histidine kinase [Bacteroidota bacterium]